MIKTVKAKVIDGVLTPLEPVSLEEGVEYRLTLMDIPRASEGIAANGDPEAFRATAGTWAYDREYWEEFKKTLYAARAAGSREPVEP